MNLCEALTQGKSVKQQISKEQRKKSNMRSWDGQEIKANLPLWSQMELQSISNKQFHQNANHFPLLATKAVLVNALPKISLKTLHIH